MARIIENPKQLILNTAKNILHAEGYADLNMRSIAKKCGIATGTIYNYFPTKRDLVVEMMADYWEEYFISLKKLLDQEKPFYQKLNILRFYVSTL